MLFMLLNVIFATAGVILSILIIIQLLLLVSDHSVGMEVRLGNIQEQERMHSKRKVTKFSNFKS